MARYSETFMEHFTSPRNAGPMEAPDVVGIAGTPGRGPYFIIGLRLGDGAVREARFQTHGCGATIAAGSALTELLRQRPFLECLELTPEDVIAALDGVPPEKLHGPALAIAALREALKGVAVEAR